MNKLIVSAVALVMAASVVPAMAITAQSGVYVGGVAGYGSAALPNNSLNGVPSTSSKEGSLAWGGMVGYNYALTDHVLVGVEAGYNQDAKASYTFAGLGNETIKSRDLDAMLTSTYQFSSGFNVFGKAGAAELRQTVDAYDGNSRVTRIRPTMKVGSGYMFDLGNAGAMDVFVQYTHIFAKNASNSNVNLATTPVSVSSVQVGVTYNLPV